MPAWSDQHRPPRFADRNQLVSDEPGAARPVRLDRPSRPLGPLLELSWRTRFANSSPGRPNGRVCSISRPGARSIWCVVGSAYRGQGDQHAATEDLRGLRYLKRERLDDRFQFGVLPPPRRKPPVRPNARGVTVSTLWGRLTLSKSRHFGIGGLPSGALIYPDGPTIAGDCGLAALRNLRDRDKTSRQAARQRSATLVACLLRYPLAIFATTASTAAEVAAGEEIEVLRTIARSARRFAQAAPPMVASCRGDRRTGALGPRLPPIWARSCS